MSSIFITKAATTTLNIFHRGKSILNFQFIILIDQIKPTKFQKIVLSYPNTQTSTKIHEKLYKRKTENYTFQQYDEKINGLKIFQQKKELSIFLKINLIKK